MAVLGARTPYEALSLGQRVPDADRRAWLHATESWARLQSVESRCKERGLWIRRKAAAERTVEGLLERFSPDKCARYFRYSGYAGN